MLAPPGFRDVQLRGTGATSRVYRAIDVRTGHPVALKRLHRQLLDTEDALARLRREFEILARLRHPALVPVRDVIRWQGDPTVVMDFIEGEDLEERIRAEGPLPFALVDRVARALFDVFAATHGAGVVHRDVKPQNVRLAADGRIFLLDFGSARFEASSELTATGATVGTPEYMAPELFAGSVYDPRVDVYAAGATLFAALTGRPPQEADSLAELAFRRARERIEPVASLREDVPPHLAQVVDRCLARVPEERYASAALAAWALDHPEPELDFRTRRAAQPPCLHCATQIPPASVICPACGSDHPFSYGAGSAHVVIRAVRDPRRLVELWSARFPERTSSAHLEALTERLAAVSWAPQRLVSFIDRREAARLADDLERAGAKAEIVEDEGTAGWRLYGWSLVFFLVALMLVGGFVLGVALEPQHLLLLAAPAALALLGERFGAVTQSMRGLLTDAPLPPVVQPGLRSGLLAGGGALGASAALTPAASGALVSMGAGSAAAVVASLASPLWVGSLGLLGAALVATWTRFSAAPRPATGSPEPSLGRKLRRAFGLPSHLAGRRPRAEVAVLLTATVLALVPSELAALGWVHGRLAELATVVAPSVPAPAAGLPAEPVLHTPAPEVPAASPAPILEGPVVAEGPVAAPPPPAAEVEAWPTAVGAGLVGLAFLAVLLNLRRRRGIRAEAEALAAELARPGLAEGGSALSAGAPSRMAPRTRQPGAALGAADLLVLEPSRDPFVAAARRRVADLAHVLPGEALDRVRGILDVLARAPSRRPEAAVVARSILESDPEQQLRFELLALEGQLEAAAAEEWFGSVRGGAEEEPP